MSGFKPGDLVDIAVKGVRVIGTNALTGAPTIVDEHGDEFPMPPQAAVSVLTPAHWPPQVGDLWRGWDGKLWFVVTDKTPYKGGEAVKLVSAEGETVHQPGILPGPGLTLVHREETDGDPS